jgi:hypothetical protein
MENIDLECAKLGQKLAGDASKAREKLLRDSLSVLRQQGLYAFFLYLKANGKEGKGIIKPCDVCLGNYGLITNPNGDITARVAEMDLDDLLFARQILLQALTYGLYHVKAKREGDRGA